VPKETASALAFFPVTPCRVVDTRNAVGPFRGLYRWPTLRSCRPPATATCLFTYPTSTDVVLDVDGYFAPPTSDLLGYLSLSPAGGNQLAVSALNAIDGALTSNMAIVPTNNGNIEAFSSNPTQLILDLSSYFAP
jgi:hypothetical protein